jgi:hypothetical protein
MLCTCSRSLRHHCCRHPARELRQPLNVLMLTVVVLKDMLCTMSFLNPIPKIEYQHTYIMIAWISMGAKHLTVGRGRDAGFHNLARDFRAYYVLFVAGALQAEPGVDPHQGRATRPEGRIRA